MSGPKVDLGEFDAFEAASAGGQPLKVDAILGELDESDPDRAAKLRAALAGPYKHSVVSRVLKTWGRQVTGDAVKAWRDRHLT